MDELTLTLLENGHLSEWKFEPAGQLLMFVHCMPIWLTPVEI